MDLDLAQLRALRAAVDAGTLDGAARALHVTPSAVSQRLKALEQAAGHVLLVRSRPVRVTEPGRALLRLAREVDLLAADAERELSGRRRRTGRAARGGQRRLARDLAAAGAGAAAATRCCSTCGAPTRTTPPRCCATARWSPP